MVKISDEKSKDLCAGCSLCCEYICVEIDKPETKSDYDEIIWMLLHQNVWVYVDAEEDEWYVQFNTPCEKLQDNKLCGDHPHRPNVCRKHTQDSCEKYGEGSYFKHMFRTKDDFIKWLKENKKDYNFKHFKH
tara:strand:+ start:126 stop:521 length:396 start_codon:yes stop_codon:yes gene_type:complete